MLHWWSNLCYALQLKGHRILTFRFMILSCVNTNISLQFECLKNKSVFSYWPLLQHNIAPLSETLCFSSCPFLAPPTCIPPIWFDQKDSIGQTSVIDVHVYNVFKQFYMENLLRQQLWNQQMPALFFFHSPYSSQCGRKANESASWPLTFGTSINGFVLSGMATALYSREYSSSAF